MDFQRVSCNHTIVEFKNERGLYMEKDCLVLLRELIIQMIQDCADTDLLDLVLKLLVELGGSVCI